MSNPNPNPIILGRAALIDRMHSTGYGSKSQAGEVIDFVLGQITNALRRGETVRFREFGVFQIKETAARQGRNIQTGELNAIPAKRRVAFKPSKSLLTTETAA